MINPSWSDYGTHDEAYYPELWRGVTGAWAPALGPTGTTLYDMALGNGKRDGAISSTGLTVNTWWNRWNGIWYIDGTQTNSTKIELLPKRSLFRGLSQATMSAWVIFPPAQTISTAFFYEGTSYAGYTRFSLNRNNTGDILGLFRDSDSGTYAFATTAYTPTANKLVHVALTFNENTDNLLLYYNGVVVGSNTAAKGPFSDTEPYDPMSIIFASYNGTIGYCNSHIVSAMAYNRELSQQEITVLQEHPLLPYIPRRKTMRRSFLFDPFKPVWGQTPNLIIPGISRC